MKRTIPDPAEDALQALHRSHRIRLLVGIAVLGLRRELAGMALLLAREVLLVLRDVLEAVMPGGQSGSRRRTRVPALRQPGASARGSSAAAVPAVPVRRQPSRRRSDRSVRP